jgi:chromosome segregation ATPase
LVDRVAQLQSDVAGIAGRINSADQSAADTVAGLQRQASLISALDRKLSILQEELPPKLKGLMDAVRDSLGARITVEMRTLDERHRTLIEGAEARLRATRETESVSAKLNSALDALMTTFETRLAAEMRTVESRALARANELEKTMQYVSMLEARIQTLETKLQRSPEEIERAVERAVKSIEARQEKPTAPPSPEPANAQALAEIWDKSSDAEKSALELIAGISHLFEQQPPSPELAAPSVSEPIPPPQPASELAPEARDARASGDSDAKPPVILFKPKEPVRKWRIPFVS